MLTEQQLHRAAQELLRFREEPNELALPQAIAELREQDRIRHALEVGQSCEQ